MKKFFTILAIAGMIVSCNNKKEEKTETTSSDTTTTTTTPVDNTTTTTTSTDNTTTTSADVPTFADAEVQTFVNDYTAFVTSYVAAYKSKDMTKISTMATDYQQWVGRTQSVSMKLANNPSDAQKFSDYMTKLSNDVQAAMAIK